MTRSGKGVSGKIVEAKKQLNRLGFTENDNIKLVGEVGGICPRCSKRLVRRTAKSEIKDYDLAHIYPCNATMFDVNTLKNEEKLSEDVNDLKNVIPLCKACHFEYDHPITIEKYRDMIRLKKVILAKMSNRDEWLTFPLREQIIDIIKKLTMLDEADEECVIAYDVKTIDDKTKPEMAHLDREKIKNNVRSFYGFIKRELSDVDKLNPNMAESITLQVKSYYVNLLARGLSKQEIYESLVCWIYDKTGQKSRDASDVVASFFVQNCEVFS